MNTDSDTDTIPYTPKQESDRIRESEKPGNSLVSTISTIHQEPPFKPLEGKYTFLQGSGDYSSGGSETVI